MSTLKRKIQKSFIYEGFGFPVNIVDVPMVKVQGEWTPDIDYNQLEAAVLVAVAHKPIRLTGNEVHFIRLSFGMTVEQFASRCDVKHPTVLAWEKAGHGTTSMKWPTEKDIRLEVLIRSKGASAGKFKAEYVALEKPPKRPKRSAGSRAKAPMKAPAVSKEYTFAGGSISCPAAP
jgi:DNA-binding transcriptional regulator YiaG